MRDAYGRWVDYMRVSITDRCNLRCCYCMPEGISRVPMEEILTLEEIAAVCTQAAALGIRKIKVTGGEPLVRPDCPKLIGMLKAIPGIEQVTLTSNGILLEEFGGELVEMGLDGVNVSLDTLDAKEFQEITGFDGLSRVLAGIARMEASPVPVKINVVLRSQRREQWKELLELSRERRLDVRFIEMMPIGFGKQFEAVSNEWVFGQIREQYKEVYREMAPHGNGPAVYYKIPGFCGSVGFISAIHGKFCSKCNRIRMTAQGQLKPCLCYGDGFSLREAVRAGKPEEVRALLAQAIAEKPEAHCFENQNIMTETREMVQIGG